MLRKVSIGNLQKIIGIASVGILVASCGSIKAREQVQQDAKPPGQQESTVGVVDLSVKDVIAESLYTISRAKNGKYYLILSNGKVLDPKRLVTKKRKIKRTNIVAFSSSSVLVTQASPTEYRINLGDEIICFVYDNVTGQYLGLCD